MARQQLLEEALKQGSVEMSNIKCLVLGIAGVGKTHLKRLLLLESTENHTTRVSTGLADNPVQAFVGSVKSILAGVDEKDSGIWEVLDEAKLMQVLATAYQKNPSPLPPTAPIATQESPHPADQQQPSTPAEDPVSKPDDKPVQSPPSTELPSSPFVEHPTPLEPEREQKFEDSQAAGGVLSQFIEALKNNKPLDLKVTLVQFIDSGGQPQFLELLPAFVQDVSAILFAVNLSESLDHCPEIYFYGQDGKPVGKPYTSPSSHKQVLEQCVRAAHVRDVHPHLFVVGTHRDMEELCSEKKNVKDDIIRNMVVNPEFLIHKKGCETIWEVNGQTPEKADQEVAYKLRRSIVVHCRKGNPPLLPIMWFVLEMQIRVTATHGILSLSMCLQLAQRLGIDEKGLEAALRHMVKYNLFLWYHNVPGLREVVFSDPQVILRIITDLVQCKHELLGDDLQQSFCSEGVKNDWCVKFKDHAIVSHEFLSHTFFKRHFFDGIFTVEQFTDLMCYRCIMVSLGNGDFLMPALLNPLSPDKMSIEHGKVDPFLVCFPNGCVPYGVFSFLVVFLQQKGSCTLVEINKVPTCLYRNCVSFKHSKFPAKFTIVDSVTYIEVHLTEGDSTKACPRIRKLIHDGIQHSAELLNYNGCKDLKDGFMCTTQSCNGVAIPYEEDQGIASCENCSCNMDLTTRHTVWLKEGTQGMLLHSMNPPLFTVLKIVTDICIQKNYLIQAMGVYEAT